ncbi:hypothetical protein [Prosthecodimorpha staleyi]|uniref:Uncharacterized protein n=1 Tax=Prosthecodimorpha staleyi TaxID=2840188 RepID=A0A947D1N7_9HYPH|nr:hypothetical protein [Prosthecodimorpha staleyi]MBT9289135.1 hypothetical protein [Prosthecodimorpha staleyi]
MTDHDEAVPADPAADPGARPEPAPAGVSGHAPGPASAAPDGPAARPKRKRRAGPPERRQRFDWRAIRAAYESGLRSQVELAADYGVNASTINYHKTREGWSEPAETPRLGINEGDRVMLVLRLFRMVDAQIGEIERRLTAADGTGPDEKDARTLAALARTIELLIDLEAKTRPEAPAAPEEGDEDAFRTELARRIRGLAGEV